MGDYVFTHLAKHKTPVDFLGIDFRYSRGHHDIERLRTLTSETLLFCWK